MTDHKLLPAGDLFRVCGPTRFKFKNTAAPEPLEELIGQNRAVEAVEFGIGIRRDGYNLFAAGPAGTGKHTLIGKFAICAVESIDQGLEILPGVPRVNPTPRPPIRKARSTALSPTAWPISRQRLAKWAAQGVARTAKATAEAAKTRFRRRNHTNSTLVFSRSTGSRSASNHGFFLSHAVLRQLGCGSGMVSGG